MRKGVEPVGVLLVLAGFLAATVAGYIRLFVPWGTRWGATDEEVQASMPGDEWLDEDALSRSRLVATRAVSIAAPVDVVWPWVAQMGRGAGAYTYDRLDNGGRSSADHIVSWIPQPRLGDASAIGFLRHLDPGHQMAWWMPEAPLFGTVARMVASYRVVPDGRGTRLVVRESADAAGPLGALIKYGFALIDTFMARGQLLGFRERAERYGTRGRDPGRAESGDRAQYQDFECVYADGTRCGRPGVELAATWHERASEELGPRMGLPQS